MICMTPTNGFARRAMPSRTESRSRFPVSGAAVGMALAGFVVLVAGIRLGAGSAWFESLSLLACLGFLCSAKRSQVRVRGVHDLPQFLGCLSLMAVAYAVYFSLRSPASLAMDGLTLAYPLVVSYLDQYLGERWMSAPMAAATDS